MAPWLSGPGPEEESRRTQPGPGTVSPFWPGACLELCCRVPSIPPRGASSPRAGRNADNALDRAGVPIWLAQGTILRGWALAEQGQGEEGIAQMRQGMAAFRATGAEIAR